jgi:transposase
MYGLKILTFGQMQGCCMGNYEVTDRFWEQAEPLLEPFKRRKSGGSPPLDFRQVMNGILYVLKSGCQWSLLPRCYGSKSAVHEHFQRWVAGGVFTALFRLGAETYEELCGFEWTWQSMDGSLVQAPVRQACDHAAEGLGRNPTDRGRNGSKLHLLVDQNGLPAAVVVVGANVHDSRLVTPTVQAGVIQPPATAASPKHLCLDKGYDYARVELEVVGLGYTPHIRRIGEEKYVGAGETHPARRWVVERTFAWLKGFRAIRTRYTGRGSNYLALVQFACALILGRRIAAASA